MAQTIKLKRSGTQNAVPSTSQLALGEVAINTYDGKMYIKKNDGSDSIVEIGGNATSSSGLDFTGNLNLADNVRIVIGDGNDLQIYHDGSHSYIEDSGTGNLYLNTTNGGGVFLTSAGENLAGFYSNGAVNLYYDNAAKLATTSSGIDVTGNINLEQTTSSSGRLNFSNSTHTGWDWQQFQNSNGELIVTISGTGGAEFQFDGDGSDYTNARFNVGGANVTATTIGNWNTAYTYSQVGHLPLTGGSLSGRLLINTASSIDNLSQLHIVGYTSGRAGITLQDGDSTTQKTFFTQSSGTTRFNTQNGTSYGSFVVGGWNGTTTADFVTVNASGNVGIGTSSPNRKLHLSGSGATVAAKIEATDGNQASVDLKNSEGEFRIISNGGELSIYDQTDTAERFRIDTSGNVGIGTNSPSRPLHVVGHAKVTGDLQVEGGDIEFNQSSGQARIRNLLQDTYIRFQVNVGGTQTNALNIRGSNAYVGIGSDAGGISPSYPLDVYNVTADTVARFTSGDNRARIHIKDDDTDVYVIAEGSKMSLGVANSLSSTNLTIDSSGNLGIGTTNPGFPLHVNSSSTDVAKFQTSGSYTYTRFQNSSKTWALSVGSSFDFYDEAASATRMVIDSSGNVGIGTSSPTDKLNISSSTNQIGLDTGDQATYGTLDVGHFTNGAFIGTQAGSNAASNVLRFGTSGVERMRINSSGNLGIGTASPGAKLTVSDTGGGNAILVTGASGNEVARLQPVSGASNRGELLLKEGTTNTTQVRLTSQANSSNYINNGGNVGIGTTSPDTKLDITTTGVHGLIINQDTSTAGISSRLFFKDSTRTNLIMNVNGRLEFRTDATIGSTSGTYRVGVTPTLFDVTTPIRIEETEIGTTTTSTSATTQVAIDAISATVFRSVRYTIQVTNSTDSTYHLTEILLIHNGTTPAITEFGTIFTGSAEATFDADISSGNVRLLATPASTDSMTFKVVRHCITV